jgi:ubiquinol-cytochrome c reductase iron-sulfur subunit
MGGAAALATAVPFVSTFAPSERAKAAGGPVEVDLSDIPPGGSKTVEWRGKPVWVVRRTPAMLAALQGHDAQLVDPKSAVDQQPDDARNAARAIRPEVFVAVGICTHLGCSPSDAPAGGPTPACLPTGRAVSSAPAMGRPSMAQAAVQASRADQPRSVQEQAGLMDVRASQPHQPRGAAVTDALCCRLSSQRSRRSAQA